jgi:hypothetical protein
MQHEPGQQQYRGWVGHEYAIDAMQANQAGIVSLSLQRLGKIGYVPVWSCMNQ